MENLGPLLRHLESLTTALDNVGVSVQNASTGLQVKLDRSSDRLGDTIKESSARLAESLNKAANASDTYAHRLLFATWALVVATIVLAIVTGAHG